MATTAAVLSKGSRLPAPGPSLSVTPDLLHACYLAHYRHVLQICRRFFRHREDAEDAAAEIFLKLYRVLPQKDHNVPFRPWVSKVAGNHCIDKLRQRNRDHSISMEQMNFASWSDSSNLSPLAAVIRKDEDHRVRTELLKLPDKYRIALVLRFYRRMSYSEIGCVLDASLPTVRILIFRAKKRLRERLRRSQQRESRQRLLGSQGNPFTPLQAWPDHAAAD